MNIKIVLLEKKDTIYITKICNWFYLWWGKDEGFSMEKMNIYILNSLCEDRIPQTYILLSGEKLVGVYQLSIMDIDVRPDIYPWLINVYIDKSYRGKGYFNELMISVKENCKKRVLSEFLYIQLMLDCILGGNLKKSLILS